MMETIMENMEEVKETVEEENASASFNMEAVTEGLLYLAGEDGLRVEQLSLAIGRSIEDCEVYLANIKRKYEDSQYGIELVDYGSVYKFITKQALAPYVQNLFQSTKSGGLSQSAMETLAIIAYKQPVTRVEIEELRGVGAEVMLRKLQARGLIREAGRSEAPGRPILYEVTDEFMDSFKLMSLNELPDLPEFVQDDENTDLFD